MNKLCCICCRFVACDFEISIIKGDDKMKIFKKTLSVFLAVLMLFSALSMSFYAFAADAKTDELYRALAYSFFNYNRIVGLTTTYELKTDANGIPETTLLGDMDQYTVSNTSDDYKYADDSGSPIRSVAYDHRVTARDNSTGTIRNALTRYLGLADVLMSKEYGVGNYTVSMIGDEITKSLKLFKGDDGEYLFLDGYTYYEDNLGNIVGRSEEKTYEVVKGAIKYFAGKAPESTTARKAVTLYDHCNVSTVIDYFGGNCTSVNTGNWFHKFIFEVVTDLETVLITEPLIENDFREYDYEITWTMNRSYDESGTKTQFYNNGYEVTKNTSVTNATRSVLVQLDADMTNFFAMYYADGVLKNMTNAQIINGGHYNSIRNGYNIFNSLSNEAKLAVFGQNALSYMNLVTQLTPIVDPNGNSNRYYPSHTYEKYQDNKGNNVVYQVDNNKITSIVNTIDNLLKSEKVGSILKTFLDFSDPKYEGKIFYGTDPKTAQDVLKMFVEDYVYSDDIINMLIGLLYPMVSNLIDENLNNGLLDKLNLSGFVSGLIGWVVGNGGLQHLVNYALSLVGVVLTPAGMAWAWNNFGYLDPEQNRGMSAVYSRNHDIMKAAGGGSGTQTAKGQTYYSIGYETDAECGHRWDALDVDQLVWGINGERDKFQSVLSGILLPLVPLLCVLLGNQEFQTNDGSGHKGLPVNTSVGWIFVALKNLTLYNDVLLPLFEALEIPNLTSARNFETAAAKANADSNRSPSSVAEFLNTILNPLLNWVENTVLADPIKSVLTILPNVSYYLTSQALLSSIRDIEIDIRISIWTDGVDFSVYKLGIASLLGDKIDFLDSLQGIIDLIGIKVDTGLPIIGYHEEGSNRVYRPGMPGYNASTMTIGVTEAYANSSGSEMLTYSDYVDHDIKITGLDADGNPNDYVFYNVVGYCNGAGEVVTEKDATHTTEVTKYYEYSVTNPSTNETTTVRTVKMPTGMEYKVVYSTVNATANAQLPAIMDYKLQACGSQVTTSSGRYSGFTIKDKNGNTLDTWGAGQRTHIDMHVNGMESHGLVLLFIFRYLFSALQYRVFDGSKFTNDYTLLDAFGISDMLNKELFAGMKLVDIINNISLHPDEAIAALLELFYKNELGSIWQVLGSLGNHPTVTVGKEYTYKLDYVNYYVDEIMTNAVEHNDFNYGTSVLYTEYWTKEDSSYVVDNLDNLVDDVFSMLKLDLGDSVGELLDGLLSQYLFNNDLLSNLVGMLYGAIDGINGVDLATILNAALDVDYSKNFLYTALKYEFDGIETDVAKKLYKDANTYISETDPDKAAKEKALAQYDKNYFYKMGVVENTDEETGEVTQETVRLEALDWGFNNEQITAKFTPRQIFVKAISAVLSPFAVLVQFLFAGEDLSLLGVVNIPGYEAYHYAWIPFMETLTATRGLIPFNEFYQKIMIGDGSASFENTVKRNCDAFYYSFIPAFNFVEDLIQDPVGILMNMLPNLLFFISIGGLNDIVNNFVHFAYVLLDILQPIFDVYPVVNSLLSNLSISGLTLNLSLPLDLDVNQLVNSLVDGLLGDMLSFDIVNKKLVIGEQKVEKEVFVPTLDEEGNEQKDEEGNIIGKKEMQTVSEPVYAVGTLKIELPYLDLGTLCSGTVQQRTSISGEQYIFLNSSGGADLVTVILRLVTDTLFYKNNAMNIADFLIGYCQLDDEDDNDELLLEIFTYLNDEAHKNEIPDKTMKLIITVYKILVPIADNLGGRFKKVDFSITDLFSDSSKLAERIQQLLGAGDSDNPTLSGFAKLIKLLKDFFAKIKLFFQQLFGKA